MWKSECSDGVQWIAGNSGTVSHGNPHGRREANEADRAAHTELGEGLKEA